MAHAVRFVVFNADESYASALRTELLSHEGVKIVGEVDEAVLLPEAIRRFSADVLLVHLDPNPEIVLPIAGEIASTNSQVAVFGLSESTDGRLILSAMRTGFREFLTKPLDHVSLSEAIVKIASNFSDEDTRGTMISVVGSCGGVGASTVAVNLAVELGQMAPKNVVVADLDYRFGQVATMLDLDPTFTIGDLCHSSEDLDETVINRALVRHSSQINVLGRPQTFGQADGITAAHCIGTLTALVNSKEFVVVDGPNRFDPAGKPVFDISDEIVLVVQLLVPSIRNAARILDGMREAGYSLQNVHVVCNRVNRESSALSINDLTSTLDHPVLAEIPDDWNTVSSAINLGEPLATHQPKSKVRLAIKSIAGQLNPNGAVTPVESTDRKGKLLSKIFSD
jgi:pilus assembly protein CpaE